MNFYKSLINPPYVIFTTAYPEFAVEGFEVNAIDYLLKPFPFERFYKAVNKAIDTIGTSKKTEPNQRFILFKADKKIHRVVINEINRIEALGDYVKVYFSDSHIVVHDTFQNVLNTLPFNGFIRVHKSHAIALNKFDIIEGNVVKIGETKIPIGQTYRVAFMKAIQNE